MKIWDVNPGYLNQEDLCEEDRTLHRIASLSKRKEEQLQSSEAIRWLAHGWAIKQRHKQVTCEMALRGFDSCAAIRTHSNFENWPVNYIHQPAKQLQLLREKYTDAEPGRIPLPRNVQELWSQHKYSTLARDPNIYKKIGRDVATMASDFSKLTLLLTELLRKRPTRGGIRNAAQHMWGYVSDSPPLRGSELNSWSLSHLLQEIQKRALATNSTYLLSSTALSELLSWLPDR